MAKGFSKLKKQRKQFEEQVAKLQTELEKTEITGEAGNGLVKITINGQRDVKSVKISPDCVDKDDVEGLEDLIQAAFNDAGEKLEKSSSLGNLGSMF